MPSCEIYGSRFAARLTYNLSQNIGGNYSVIRITKVELKSLQSMPTTECWVKGSISVNGGNACTLELTDTTACSVTMSQSYDGGGEGNGWFSGFSTRDVVIGHGEDGNGGFSVYASLDVIMTNQIGLDPGIRNSAYVGLPQIPRVSSLSAGGVVLGQEMTIRISRASDAFSDTVTWRCGSLSGTIADRTTASELKWTPAVDLAAQAPDSTTVSIELTIQTFVNGSQVGSRVTNVSCTVPGWVVPTVTAAVSDRMGYADRYGGYVQSQSQARIVTTAAGAYGSSIRSIAVRCGGLTGSGADVSFALGESGQLPVTVTVTDSRGRTAQWSSSINVLPYRKPQVTVTQAYRCDSQGNPQPDGVWLRVIFDGTVTALTGNGATYRGICRVHGGTGERSVLLADYTGWTTVAGGSFLLTAGLDTGYDCSVTVQDNFSTVESSGALVSVAFALLDFDRQNKAVGIGMRAKNPGKVSIGLDVNMEEHRLGNLLDPSGSRDAATKGYVDTAVRKAALRNLLDNSDFRNPVEQAGRNGLHGTAKYAIDRWLCEPGADASGALGSDLVLVSDKTNWVAGITQNVDTKLFSRNKVYTFAVYGYINNACRLLAYNGDDVFGVKYFGGNAAWETYTMTFTVPDTFTGNYVRCMISTDTEMTGNAAYLRWAALYEGSYTAETLPEYQPKGYGAELAECQRYYYTFQALVGTQASAAQRVFLTSPVKMRIIPSVDYRLIAGSAPNFVQMQSSSVIDMKAHDDKYSHLDIELSADL